MLGSWRRMKVKSNTFFLRTNRLWIIQPPPTRATPSTFYIRAIGSALLDRFRVFSRFDDTESAIRPLNPSVTSTSSDDTTFPDSLSKLSIVHCVSATPWTQQTSTSKFQTGTKGVHLAPKDNPELQFWLGSLGVSFETRFRHKGDLADIENAIARRGQSNTFSDNDFNIPYWLGNLGSYHQILFKRTQDLAHSQLGTSYHQKAFHAVPVEHPNRPRPGVSFKSASHTRNLEDIANVNQQKAASDDRSVKPLLLRSLGTSFLVRFNRTRALADIESSISNHQLAVGPTAEEYVDMPSLVNSQRSRFERTDIHSTITCYRRAATHISGLPIFVSLLLANGPFFLASSTAHNPWMHLGSHLGPFPRLPTLNRRSINALQVSISPRRI